MNALFNTVSNSPSGTNTGNSIMANGDTAILAVGSYKCPEGTCASSDRMLYTDGLNGEVKCVEDNASCVLDGQSARRMMSVKETRGLKLALRALTFQSGEANSGGGANLSSNAIVDILLCTFSSCRSTETNSHYGGGALFVELSTVTVQGSHFTGNTAASGNGGDIYNYDYNPGTITIYDAYPSPYTATTPTQGRTSTRRWTDFLNLVRQHQNSQQTPPSQVPP